MPIKFRLSSKSTGLSEVRGLTDTSHMSMNDLVQMAHNLAVELKRVNPSSHSGDLTAEGNLTFISEVECLRKIFRHIFMDMNSREESTTDETVVYNGNPLEMGSGGIKYSELEKLLSMKIVGVLLATPNVAMEEIANKFDVKTIERNLFLCGLCLISMGYLPNELKYIKRWTVFDRNRDPVTNPGIGLHFVVNSKPNSDWCRLPIPREFVPTAFYLNDHPEVWQKISASFDFNKMFEKYKSKICGVPFLECKAIKKYLAEGGKFETISKYVTWIIEVMGLGYKVGTEDVVKLYPQVTTIKMKNFLPEFYLMKWAVVMSFTKDLFEPDVVVDCPPYNPIEDMMVTMVEDVKNGPGMSKRK